MVGWSADGSRLYFQESYHTTTRLYSVLISYGEPEVLYAGGANVDFNLNSNRTWIGFAHQAVEQAVEAFATPVSHSAPRAVSSANSASPLPPVGKTETIHWTGAQGKEIEGLLTFSVSYRPGNRVPLMLVIHGGPAGVFAESYPGNASVYPIGVFAAKGYAILRVNPRGSSGYGSSFRNANYKDWGGLDYQDLMTGVDRVSPQATSAPM